MSKLVLEQQLPRGWTKTNLENTVEILDGGRRPVNSKERQKRIGNIPYYGATGQVGLIDDYLFDEELVLLGEDGAPFFEYFKNKAYLINDKSWVNNHAHVLKGISNLLLNKFLCHYLNQIDYHEYVNGTTRLKLNQASMKTIPLVLPPMNEQKRIVEKIEELFSKLIHTELILQKMKLQLIQYRQSMLNSLVTGDFFNNGIEYEQIPLGTIIESINQGWSPKCENNFSLNDDEWAVITTTSIQHMKFDGSQNKILPNNLEPRPKLELKENDLLITRAGPRSRVGVACLVKKTKNRLLLCDKAYRIRFDENVIDPSFFEIILNTPHIIAEIDRIKTGTSDSGLNLTMGRFSNLVIPLPLKSQQNKIVVFTEQTFSFIQNINNVIDTMLKQLHYLRSSILTQAFEGKLVPQDPNDESAEILLQKIKQEKEQLKQKEKSNKRKKNVK